MKNIFIAILLVALPLFAWADPWDNLTEKEAKSVQEVLKKNPYIFDYCDCCDANANLLEVISTEVVPCEWDAGKFSVKAKVRHVSIIPFTEKGGLELKNILNPDEAEPSELGAWADGTDAYTVTMNYTWVYDKDKKMGVPLYVATPYDYQGVDKLTSGVCQPFFSYPAPLNVGDMGYEDWYYDNVDKKGKKKRKKRRRKRRKKKRNKDARP